MDTLTMVCPAKCTTASNFSRSNTDKTFGEFISATSNRVSAGIFFLLPEDKLSNTKTSNCFATSFGKRCEPINPAPPVTNTFIRYPLVRFAKYPPIRAIKLNASSRNSSGNAVSAGPVSKFNTPS